MQVGSAWVKTEEKEGKKTVVSISLFPDYKRWTRSAIECYDRGCICFATPVFGGVDAHLKGVQPCPIRKNYSFRCQMKAVVLYLCSKFGNPPEEIREQIRKEEERQ